MVEERTFPCVTHCVPAVKADLMTGAAANIDRR